MKSSMKAKEEFIVQRESWDGGGGGVKVANLRELFRRRVFFVAVFKIYFEDRFD